MTENREKLEISEVSTPEVSGHMPQISVVIPLYNHDKYIAAAISSVFCQAVSDIEIIVINDGSTDKSEDVVLNLHDDRIRYYYQSNQGACFAINRGICLARGKYVCILNSDDMYAPDRFHDILEVMTSDPSIDAVFSQVEQIDGEGNLIPCPDNTEDNRYYQEDASEKDYSDILLRLLGGNFLITTSNLFCKCSIFENIDGFRNLFYTHDYDFFLRLCYRFNVKVLKKKLLQYRIHDANTIRNRREDVSFEVGMVLSDFLIHHDIKNFTESDDVETRLLRIYQSLNTFNSDRMMVALLLAGFKYRNEHEIFESLTENSSGVFRKICVSDVAARNSDWESSQNAWSKWEETNQRLSQADEALSRSYETNKELYQQSREAWSKWEETNEQLRNTKIELLRSNETNTTLQRQQEELWSKWEETNEQLRNAKMELLQSSETNTTLQRQLIEAWSKWKETNERLNRVESELLQSDEINTKLQKEINKIRENWENERQKLLPVKLSEAQYRSEIQNLRCHLNQTYDDLNRTRGDLDRMIHDLEQIHLSRVYKCIQIFRECRLGRKDKLLLPFRLIWLILPQTIRGAFLPAAHYMKTRLFVPKRLRMPLWPDTLPLISVVIYFTGADITALKSSLTSLSLQTLKNIDVLIIYKKDEFSPSVFNDLKSTNIFFRILSYPGRSYSTILNWGIKKTKGKYVCCLSAGAAIAPTYLEKCLYQMETEALDVCSSHWIFQNSEPSIIRPDFDRDIIRNANTISEATLFSRTRWKRIGKFDNKLKDSFVFWDFWIRAVYKNAKIACISETLVHHCNEPMLATIHGKGFPDDARFKSKINKMTTAAVQVALEATVVNPFINLRSIRNVDIEAVRVLVVMPFLTMGGAEKVISQICSYLAQKQFRVTLVTTLPWDIHHGDTTSWFEPSTVDIFHLPRFLSEEKWREFIFYLITSRDIQIIWQVGSAFLYDMMPDIKSFFPHIKILDILFNEVGHTPNNRKYNYCIDLNITENHTVWQWLMDHGETADHVVCIPSGVNLAEFYPYDEKPVAHLKLSENKKPFIVGYCGRFSEEKQPETFIEIAHKLRDEKNIEFIMTGGGPLVDQTLSLIAFHNLKRQIHFYGIVEDVKPYLGCCDALILPSKLDGRPTIVLQALAMGVPVIASNVGSLPEIIKNGENGFLCKATSVDEFVSALRKMAADACLHQTMCKYARAYAETHLDAMQWFKHMEQSFRGLLSPKTISS